MLEESLELSGLRTLEDISGLILHSHDLQETLTNIVNLVARTMGSDVCSIYLLEDDGETLTLKATRGLSQDAVGKVTMKTSEGLTGMVVEKRDVVMTDEAPLHPRYKYFREAREEKFHSFLGLPIMQRKAPIGVIVVQTREPRTFRPQEISVLSTISSQISSIVINAKLLDSIRQKEEERAYFERELERLKQTAPTRKKSAGKRFRGQQMLAGVGVSTGFSIGKVYIINRYDGKGEIEEARPRAEEKKRFQLALEKARIQTLYMEKRVAQTLSEHDAAIFHTHLMILEDRGFTSKIVEKIEQDFATERAVREVVGNYIDAFNQMEDPYLRERSADMEDIGRRIIDCLDGNERNRIRLREKRIIVAEEILPSDMATLDHEKILGIMTERGDANSHAAIMAKSLGIPAVLGVEGLLKKVGLRDEVIVDGNSGHVFINPDAKVKSEYDRLQADFVVRRRELEGFRDKPGVTADGHRVFLRANIGLLSDIKVALENGAEGVGLYRTEFPYMARSSFPHRNEQYGIYRRILEGFPGQQVSIRTLDIGGDKALPYFPYPREDNPFMGWRSIRVSLERQDIFREQLAAILMASLHGQANIMFPMISGVDEVRTVKRILAEVKGELTREGHSFDPDMKMGIMIELPAAVQTAEMLVREVDYFSIGTNDLIQYTLAADRNNPKVRKYYNPHHPAVLHSIKKAASTCVAAGKPVSLCGEMAADPVNAILLLGMGICCFSLSAPSIPVVKQALLRVNLAEAQEIADYVLRLESAAEVDAFLEGVRKKLGL